MHAAPQLGHNNPPSDLDVIPATSEITAYNPFRAELAEFKAQNATLVFDYESPKGNKEARSHVYKLRQSKAAVDKARKEEKAASLEYGRKVDAEASAIISEIEAMIDVHAKPLAEIEQREKDRVAAIQNRLSDIINAASSGFDATSAEIADRLAKIKTIAIDDSFAEFAADAAKMKDATVQTLERHLSAAMTREAEKAEVERLRQEAAERDQRERDERLQREAAEVERVLAEAKEKRERKEAEAKAQAEKDAIERKAKADREAAEKRELELKLAAEKALREKAEAEKREAEAAERERERLAYEAVAKAAEDAKREANKKHQASVHAQIVTGLKSVGISEEHAQGAVRAIRQGQIEALKIIY